LGVQDVALLAVLVLHQRDTRRAIRIVLDLAHRGRLAEAVALEVDDAVLPLVTTTDATHRDVAVIVTPAALLDRLEQRLLRRAPRDLRKIGDRAEPAALGDWLELTNWHVRLALEDLDLVAVGELDDRPLPVRLAPDALPHPLRLAAMVRRPHPGHLDAEQRLDGLANLQLVGVGVHLEVVLPTVLVRDRARFGDERSHDRAMKRRHRLLLLLLRGLLRGRLLGRGLLRRLGFLLGALLRGGLACRLGLGLRRRLRRALRDLPLAAGDIRRGAGPLHRRGRRLLDRLQRLAQRARL